MHFLRSFLAIAVPPCLCIKYHKLLCPDRSIVRIGREHITGYDVSVSYYVLDRSMTYNLQKLSGLVHSDVPILWPEPYRRLILPYLPAAQSINVCHDFIHIVIMRGFRVHFYKPVGKAAMQEQNIVDPVDISNV